MRERIVHAVAGSLILTSIALAAFFDTNWIWLGIFVGANLLQSSITNFCLLAKILQFAGKKN